MKKCLFCLVILAVLLCGCGEKEAEKANVTIAQNSVLENDIPNVNKAESPKNENLLTGELDLTPEAIGKRPVAVMINNVKEALPQYGVAQADVIFEMPVEGDLTRLMALYADYTQMPDICAIRSCRYYYPAVAKGFDAFYVHWGMDPTVTSYVSSLKMDRYDGMNNKEGLFGRDSARRSAGYSMEHTGYFKGSQFATYLASTEKRTDLLESKKGSAFRFCPMGEKVTPTSDKCSSISVKFGAASAGFTYDEAKGIYYKTINGNKHIDGKTGGQLSFANVFVLETSISVRDEGGHKSLNWAGSSNSKGYYFSNGAMQEIRWSKEGGTESGYLKFYDVNGKELTINRGKTYIAYTYAGKTTWN